MVTYNVDELLHSLPGGHRNGRANCINFTCPLCGHGEAYALAEPGKTIRCNCPACFRSSAIAAALNLNGATVVADAPQSNGVAPAKEEPPSLPPREPGADEEEDQFQQEMLRWKAGLFQVGQTLVERDLELRKLEGEDLFNALVESLLQLMGSVRGYEAPALLPPDDRRVEIESIARLLVPPVKAKAAPAKPPPIVEVLELTQLYHLIDEWDRQPWVWDQILPHRSLSLIVGKSETGKSTLIYSLIYAIVTGQDFFGRHCEKGTVIYLAGDPVSEIVAGKTFREFGVQDGITVLAGALVAHPQGIKLLRTTIERIKPVLVVADTLAATVPIDTDKYGQSYQTQQPLSLLAREFGPNLMMSHHSQKSIVDTYNVIDAALGSVGVAAVASSRMATKMYRRAGKKFFTFEMSNLRMGQPLEGEWIVHKMDDGHVDLAGLWKSRNTEMDKELILTALNKRGEPMAKRTLWRELRPKPKYDSFNDALEALVDEGKLERHSGRGSSELFGPPYFFTNK